MVARTIVLTIAFVAGQCGGAIAQVRQFFVAPNGDDAAAGTQLVPWRTLQHAADSVGPGDRVTVRPGNYAGFHLETSGTGAAPIEFFAEPGVLVDRPNPNPLKDDHGINLENASHVIIDGFSVTGMLRAGVRTVGVDGDTFASHVTIRNVHSYDNGYWGILTGFVHDLVIENNETSGSFREHGIYVSNSGDRPIIRNNLVYDNHGNGIHINGDAEEGGDGIISRAVVSGNRIFNNALPNELGLGGGSGINMDGVQDSLIENNLLYNNHASGISLYRINGGGGSTGNVVVNNTVYQASDGRWALNIRDGSSDNTAYNNILISQHATRGAISITSDSLPGFASDYNVVIERFSTNGGVAVQSMSSWQTNTGNDMHSLVATANQLFVDPSGTGSADYHLSVTAPAINRGTDLFAPRVDFDGVPRPVGAIDIGAFEWQAVAIPGDYNRDSVVDAGDYVVWRNTIGQSVTPFSGADGDGDGNIDADDFVRWKANFGRTAPVGSGGAVSVPEPELRLFALLAAVPVVFRRQPTRYAASAFFKKRPRKC